MDYPIEHITIVDKELDVLLGDVLFSNLQRLELQVAYDSSSKAAGFAMANLLHCCPVVCDLRLKLTKRRPRQSASDLHRLAETKAQSDFNESVDHFKHFRISLGGDGRDGNYEVSDIPGLSEHSFNCMRKHLRWVGLQFRMEEPNCFVAQLAKFFTENAVLLEEMYIDDGNHRLCDHLSRKVGRWTRKSSESRDDSPVPAQREGGDRLSKLSNGVLGHILSFLPAFEAARMTVLSRRWRHIFAAVHKISLDPRERPIRYIDKSCWPPWPVPVVDPEPFGDVISAALLGRGRHRGAPLRELRVAFRDLGGVNPAMVDQWLCCAMQLASDEFHLDMRLGGNIACSLGHRSSDQDDAMCDGEPDDEQEYPASPQTDAVTRAIPVPTRLFSCVMLRSLCLGPCRLDMPAAIDLPSLEMLFLTRVLGPGAGAQVQRLVTACPRLADLTLEACASLTTLSVLDNKRLRRLALRCCHKLAAVAADASELRVFEYRGVVPAPPFLTMQGPLRISYCALELCGGEAMDPSELGGFLQLLACAKHLQLCSGGVGHDVFSYAPAFPTFASLRRLELTGLSPRDGATVVAAVTRMLEQTPSLETLSLFFLPEPQQDAYNDQASSYDYDPHQLKYDRHVGLAVPDGAEIPCMTQRVREINLVHYQGAVWQRMLAKFLLRNAPGAEELCCVFAPGPLWMQTKLVVEMSSWAINSSIKLDFI
ncbi:unnamed protein product [Urochloa humidicola]